MAKKKAATAAPIEEATPEAQIEGATEQAPPEEASGKKVSKMEAVRQLLADDPEMKPNDGVEAIRARFGMEMSTGNFSAYKSQIKQKGGSVASGEKRGRKATGAAANSGSDPFEAAQSIKILVGKYGKQTVIKLAELFGT